MVLNEDIKRTKERIQIEKITLQIKGVKCQQGNGEWEGKDLCMIIINGNWWHKRVMRMREFIGFRQARKGHVSIAIESK